MQTALNNGKGEESTRGYEMIQDAIKDATDDVDWCVELGQFTSTHCGRVVHVHAFAHACTRTSHMTSLPSAKLMRSLHDLYSLQRNENKPAGVVSLGCALLVTACTLA